MNAFHELESPIYDLKNAAQVLATLFEDVEGEQVGSATRYVFYDHEHTLLAHMVYDLCRRSNELDRAFHAAFDGDKGEVADAA